MPGPRGKTGKQQESDELKTLREEVSALRADMKRREAGEREARKELDDILVRHFELSPDPIGIYVDDKLLYVNRAAVEFFRAKEPEELLGKAIIELVHPDDRQTIAEHITRLVETGIISPVMGGRYLRLDGTVGYLETSAMAITFRGKRAYQAIGRDVTQRKEAEDALRESEKRYRLLLDTAPDPIAVYSNGILTYLNKAASLALGAKTQTELLGRHMFEFIHPEFHQIIRDRIVEMARTGESPPMMEQKYVRLDGSVIVAEVSSTPIMYDGKPAFQAILRDITKKKQHEEELRKAREVAERAYKLKDHFVALVSHDLRSPITSVLSLIRLIVRTEGRNKSSRPMRMLEKAADSCEMMLEMIDRLLDISRLQSGNITLTPAFRDAREVAGTSIAGLLTVAEGKGISIRNDVPAGTRVRMDRDMVQRVLQNIISNAIKFCAEGGRITLFIPEGTTNTIAVRDTGAGIDPAMVPDLFRTEVRTSTLGTSGEKGTGLGLPMCREIMDAHGGGIRVESAPEAGTTFFIDFPAGKPLILVADDDETMRFVLRNELAALKAEVVETGNGLEAANALQRISPDLIITDLSMPVMDGFRLISHVRANNRTKGIPIIVVTSRTDPESRTTALTSGANEFLPKPVDGAEFSALVGKYV